MPISCMQMLRISGSVSLNTFRGQLATNKVKLASTGMRWGAALRVRANRDGRSVRNGTGSFFVLIVSTFHVFLDLAPIFVAEIFY